MIYLEKNGGGECSHEEKDYVYVDDLYTYYPNLSFMSPSEPITNKVIHSFPTGALMYEVPLRYSIVGTSAFGMYGEDGSRESIHHITNFYKDSNNIYYYKKSDGWLYKLDGSYIGSATDYTNFEEVTGSQISVTSKNYENFSWQPEIAKDYIPEIKIKYSNYSWQFYPDSTSWYNLCDDRIATPPFSSEVLKNLHVQNIDNNILHISLNTSQTYVVDGLTDSEYLIYCHHVFGYGWLYALPFGPLG